MLQQCHKQTLMMLWLLQGDSNVFCCAHGGNGTGGKNSHLLQVQMWQNLVAVHVVHVSLPRLCSLS